jgi:hypothetical protein
VDKSDCSHISANIVLKKSFFCKRHCELFFGEAITRLTGQTDLLEIASAAKNAASQ